MRCGKTEMILLLSGWTRLLLESGSCCPVLNSSSNLDSNENFQHSSDSILISYLENQHPCNK